MEDEESDDTTLDQDTLPEETNDLTFEQENILQPSPPLFKKDTHTSKITKKRELKGSDIELQKLSVLKQMANVVQNTNNDSFNLFGQQIAEELRKIKDNMVQTRLKRNIMNMIYDAQESEMYTQQQHATTSHTSSKYPAMYPTYPSPSQPPAGYYTSQQPPH